VKNDNPNNSSTDIPNNATPSTDASLTTKSSKINDEIKAIYNKEEWLIVIGADKKLADAKFELEKALKLNSNSNIILRDGFYRTALMGYATQADAEKILNDAKKINPTAYIRNKYEWCRKGITEGEQCLICN
jgi:hypothetical protein